MNLLQHTIKQLLDHGEADMLAEKRMVSYDIEKNNYIAKTQFIPDDAMNVSVKPFVLSTGRCFGQSAAMVEEYGAEPFSRVLAVIISTEKI